MLSYIPREYMYLDILHVFYTYPKRVQDTFRIHIKYIKIHVSCALPSCHTGYMSGYIRIHVSWTLHHDTSGYTEIQNHDTCGIHAGYMRETCGIHAGHVSRGFVGMYRCHHGEQRTPIRPPMSSLCRNGSSPAPSSSCIFSFVMATLIPAGLPPMSSAKLINFSCFTVR